MQNLYKDVSFLDKKCYEKFNLLEDILMEHAAEGVNRYIRDRFKKESKILIVSGPGNNGGDGVALARLLERDYKVSLISLQHNILTIKKPLNLKHLDMRLVLRV
ncbi:MAG TPA: hypothetical protein EYP79_00235 [Campylobacterales bacterium]|nr:hypothetical protein [Campylobacterales bacterium]